jgi:hypothetical protein
MQTGDNFSCIAANNLFDLPIGYAAMSGRVEDGC